VSDSGLDEIRAELLDRYGLMPPSVERLLGVSRLRFRAEEAGLTQVALESGQIVFRFGPDWSRAATMRALAPRSVDDPLRALQGRIKYASNQVRVRPPAEAERSWRLAQSVVERLAESAAGASVGTV
jgi:transcription-repair coupling factor (superfamily II helicase)